MWESCTSTHTAAVSVWRMQRLGLLHRAVCTIYQKGMWMCLMLGLTTVLWLCVERYCLGKEQAWMLEVSNAQFQNSFQSYLYNADLCIICMADITTPSIKSLHCLVLKTRNMSASLTRVSHTNYKPVLFFFLFFPLSTLPFWFFFFFFTEEQYDPVLVRCVVAALLSLILNIILTCILCKTGGWTYLQSAGKITNINRRRSLSVVLMRI